MAARIRMHGWDRSALGAIDHWPQSLRTAVDLMLAMPGAATLLWGHEHVQIYNDAYVAIARDRHPELLGRPAAAGWPDVHDTVIAPLLRAAYRGRAVRLNDFAVWPEGPDRREKRYFDTDWSPVRDETGAVAGVLQTLVEVTERRLAQMALRESQARHRLFNGAWMQAEWETDARGVVTADSPSWRAYTGQTLDEWLGYGWLDAIHPDDRGYAERQWRDAVAMQGLVDAEFRLRAPDGGWRWTNVRAAPVIDEGGRVEKWAGVNIDIDARKRADTALRESEAKYRFLFDAMDEAYAVVEVLKDEAGRWSDFRFLDANPAFVKHTSMPYPVGKTATELLGAPNRRWAELYGEALDRGEPLRVEESEATLDRTFDLNIFTLDRAQRRVAVLFTDVTARNRTQAALRESEERLAAAFESVPVGLAVIDTDGRTIVANGEYRRLLPADVMPSRDPVQRQRWHAWDAAGNPIVPEGFPGARALRGETVVPGLDMLQTLDDGRRRWTNVATMPTLDAAGTVAGFVIVISDIDDLKRSTDALRESEERQRALIEGVPQLVWRAAAAGQWTWASPQWTTLTGQRDTESHGDGWLAALHPDDRARATDAWAEAEAHGRYEAEYRIGDRRGLGYRWFQTRATPRRDDAGRIVEWLGTSTDVDDLRQLQERQRILVAELQHRTFNLLGLVRSTADATIRSSSTLGEFKAMFGDRIAALARVQRLLSRLDERDRITFDALIRCELEAAGALGGDETRVTLAGPDGIALRSGTVQTFAMALHELTTNAAKYGALRQPGAHLAVSWRIEAAADGAPWLHVDWIETGVAMPTDAVPRGTGQGRRLIEEALPYQLQAKTTYALTPDGVRCSIALPVSRQGPAASER